MGYTTYFEGGCTFNKPVDEKLKDYLNRFSESRRMARDTDKIKKLYPNWKDECLDGELGEQGEFFIGQANPLYDETVLDVNLPPDTQPGLWCQWIIDEVDGEDQLVWDEGEKFYEYEEWLVYLIDKIFAPRGYVLNGEIEYQGEDSDDFGKLIVENNVVTNAFGVKQYGQVDLSEVSTEELENELAKRKMA